MVLRVKRSRGRGHCHGLSSLGLPWRVAVTQFWTGTGGVPDSVSGLSAGAAEALVVRLGAERNLSSSKFAPDLGPELALILVVVVVVVCVCSSGSLFVR